MARLKTRYRVSRRYYLVADDEENNITDEWVFVGETFAVSEAQAINNVRHRTMGDASQYLPVATSGHWENGYDWKAEEV